MREFGVQGESCVVGREDEPAPRTVFSRRGLRIVAELVAETRYVNVDRAVEGFIAARLGELQERLARQNPARPLGQDAENRKLERRPADGSAHRRRVHDERPELNWSTDRPRRSIAIEPIPRATLPSALG
jgi:hypothetical protein